MAEELLGGPIVTIRPLVHSRRNVTRGVWRLSGHRGSLILKVVGPGPPAASVAGPHARIDDRTAIHDWRREPDILDGGLPAAYAAASVRGPRLLRREDRPDTIALWLEDVAGRPAAEWTLDDFGTAMERLGRAQGRAARAGLGIRPPSWASRRFLRQHLARVDDRVDWQLLDDDRAWARAEAAGFAAPGLRAAARRLRDARVDLLGLVESGPQTIAHLDVWPHNMFADDDATVLIDWAFAGVGGLGEDLGNLVPDAVFDLIHPSRLLVGLDGAVVAGYLAGLRASGWDGDPGAVRRTMRAASVKYAWIAPAALAEADDPAPAGYGGQAIADPAFWLAERAAVIAHLGGWAEEAVSAAS